MKEDIIEAFDGTEPEVCAQIDQTGSEICSKINLTVLSDSESAKIFDDKACKYIEALEVQKAINNAAMEEAKSAFKRLKTVLKPKSKSQLIELIWNYASDLQGMRTVCKQLIEENKKLMENKK